MEQEFSENGKQAGRTVSPQAGETNEVSSITDSTFCMKAVSGHRTEWEIELTVSLHGGDRVQSLKNTKQLEFTRWSTTKKKAMKKERSGDLQRFLLEPSAEYSTHAYEKNQQVWGKDHQKEAGETNITNHTGREIV